MGGVCLEKSVRVSSTPNLAVLKNPRNRKIFERKLPRQRSGTGPTHAAHPLYTRARLGYAVAGFPRTGEQSFPAPAYAV